MVERMVSPTNNKTEVLVSSLVQYVLLLKNIYGVVAIQSLSFTNSITSSRLAETGW